MVIPRERFLKVLTEDWAVFPQRLNEISPVRRKDYLESQGYPDNPNGLLGHILSWWEDGSRVVNEMRCNPAFTNPDYDVDAFNARAVDRFSAFGLSEMLETYERMRSQMVALVSALSETELNDPRINERLRYELIVHLTEHPLP